MIKRALIIIILLTLTHFGFTQNIRIGLFHKFEVKTLVFKPIRGSFFLENDQGYKEKIKVNDVIYITLVGKQLSIWGIEKHMGLSQSLKITPKKSGSLFSLQPAFPILSPRRYQGRLEINIHPDNKLSIINEVDFEKYVAAVVEAESGTRAMKEFYKSQAIISRTYALNHIDRHENEDYNLCDDVHCQVYKGIRTQNAKIAAAVEGTNGVVITDKNMQLITAAFHSNSGGYTINSEDVWTAAMPYLRGIKDPYWSDLHNSRWTDTIKMEDWIKFLDHIGVKLPANYDSNRLFAFKQNTRVRNIIINSQNVPLKNVRSYFHLRSTFFSMYPENGIIILKGRGYGHGVGLSQEGAMKMAKTGKTYDEIINFYYHNVQLINIDSTTYLTRLLNE